ncbi:MAG: YqgE/AlgH family protein [Desulfosarcina sp.]|nr:YqgE/AlgH family protein [Desulfobacterales bacterium]
MEYENATALKGKFLIAMPGMTDPNFHRSVICISEHNTDGAVGIVINNVHPVLSAKMIFKELNLDYAQGAEKKQINIGGPVHINEIFVLHGHPFKSAQTLMVNDELAMSNSIDIIKDIALEKGPESYIISLGCAGWGPGQLENELLANYWLTSPYSKDILFDIPVEARWEESIRKIGVDPVLLLNTAGHA